MNTEQSFEQSSLASLQRGPGSLPSAYQRMLQRDVHAPNSVDRALMSKMIRLTDASADYLYRDYTPIQALYEHGFRPEVELAVRRALQTPSLESHSVSLESLRRVTAYLSRIASTADDVFERVIPRLGYGTALAPRRGPMKFSAAAESLVRECDDVARIFIGGQSPQSTFGAGKPQYPPGPAVTRQNL